MRVMSSNARSAKVRVVRMMRPKRLMRLMRLMRLIRMATLSQVPALSSQPWRRRQRLPPENVWKWRLCWSSLSWS